MRNIAHDDEKQYVPRPHKAPPPQQGNSPEGFAALAVDLHVVLQGRRLALAQPVDVHYGHQVVQLVVRGEGHGLPDGALRALAVAHHAVHAVATARCKGQLQLC